MDIERIPLTIPVKPWFQDHCFGGRVVLPAVETMLLLAARVVTLHPEVDIRIMKNVRFAKFLEIPPETESLATLIEYKTDSDERVQVKLLSRIQFKAMSRVKEHGAIVFSPPGADILPTRKINSLPPERTITEINVKQLYRELVPFGPSYHTLQETLCLSDSRAWGRVKAPELPIDPVQELIGSPFPLDGALHAACVLGQQSVDFVPFPVGFERRVITRPTQPGCCYNIWVIQLSLTDGELCFDLDIFDNDGQVYETITGVRMRDVKGALKK